MNTSKDIQEPQGNNANRVLAKVISWFRIRRKIKIPVNYPRYTHASVVSNGVLEITRNPTHPNGFLYDKINLPKNKHGWRIKSMDGEYIVVESDFR